MKKNIVLLMALTLGVTAFAQDKPGIGINNKKPADSSILDIKAEKKGVLIPRVALKTLTAGKLDTFGLSGDASVSKSLTVFNTEATAENAAGDKFVEGFYFWNGTKWEAVTSETKLEKVITETKTELQTTITEKITEITKIEGNDPTDLSYMVAFKPDPLQPGEAEPDARKGVLMYLVPGKPDADGKIKYEKKEISFGELVSGSETLTKVERYIGDGTDSKKVQAVKPSEAEAKVAGKIFYTYLDEKKEQSYIDVTSDMQTILKENKTIREQLVKVISEVVNEGNGNGGGTITPGKEYGNVYYGPVGPVGPDGKPTDVLYSLDKDNNKHYIDISQNIITEITNPEVIERLKETIRVEVGKEVDKDAPTGETIGGKRVFKGMAAIVVDGNYNSDIKDAITIHPTKVVIKDGKAVVEPDNAVNFGRLLNVTVLAKDGSVIVNSATDVVTSGDKAFKFSFGIGNMYTPIDGGSYDVVFEYLEK